MVAVWLMCAPPVCVLRPGLGVIFSENVPQTGRE